MAHTRNWETTEAPSVLQFASFFYRRTRTQHYWIEYEPVLESLDFLNHFCLFLN